MALRDQPYLPLYIQDFLTDEKLAECSAHATGIYIRLMCLFHKSDPYGQILLKQKDKQTLKQTKNFARKLARNFPWSEDEIEAGLDELVTEGVITVEGDRLYQKRMVKDNEISELRSEAGAKGGKKTQQKTRDFNEDFAKAKVQANTENENEYKESVNSFGKTENLFFGDGQKQPIVQTLANFWKTERPTYPEDREHDFGALFSIGQFIAKQIKKPWLPYTPDEEGPILTEFLSLTRWINSDLFYSGLSLTSIAKTSTLQTIWQKSKSNGTNKTPPRKSTNHTRNTEGVLAALDRLERAQQTGAGDT